VVPFRQASIALAVGRLPLLAARLEQPPGALPGQWPGIPPPRLARNPGQALTRQGTWRLPMRDREQGKPNQFEKRRGNGRRNGAGGWGGTPVFLFSPSLPHRAHLRMIAASGRSRLPLSFPSQLKNSARRRGSAGVGRFGFASSARRSSSGGWPRFQGRVAVAPEAPSVRRDSAGWVGR
jgi:hypothetical protein